jgi:hypothetical protein
LTALTAYLAFPRAGRADFYLHAWENEHENAHEVGFEAQGGFYLTKNNFDGAGNLLIPTNFTQYSREQFDLLAAWGISSRLTAYARLSWARSELDQTTQIGNNFGFGDNSAGLNFRLYDAASPTRPDGFTLDLQAQCDFPLYSNTNLTGPALGDGTVDLTGGLFASLPLAHLRNSTILATAGAGFTYRTSSFSLAIPWSAVAELKPRNDGILLAVKALGLQSLDTDPRGVGLAVGSTTLSAQSGGSFITNAVNPSQIVVRGEAGYQFTRDLGVGAFFGQSVWGLASPNGFYTGGFLTARLGSRPGGPATSLSAQEYGRSNQGFINYGLEAKVTRVNDRLNLVKIDKGMQDGIAAGQTLDIFIVKKNGEVGEAIARGHVSAVQANESAVTIDEYYKEIWIDEGFVAKRPVE